MRLAGALFIAADVACVLLAAALTRSAATLATRHQWRERGVALRPVVG